jgi:hypothetical protein
MERKVTEDAMPEVWFAIVGAQLGDREADQDLVTNLAFGVDRHPTGIVNDLEVSESFVRGTNLIGGDLESEVVELVVVHGNDGGALGIKGLAVPSSSELPVSGGPRKFRVRLVARIRRRTRARWGRG